MLRIDASEYVELGRLFESMFFGLPSTHLPGVKLSEENRSELLGRLGDLKTACARLEMNCSEDIVGQAVQHFSSYVPNFGDVRARAPELYRVVLSELKRRFFVCLLPHKVEFYRPPATATPPEPLFGAGVDGAFGSAHYDIHQAGNCYATNNNTACVFHLMRVLEIGLGALGGVFGVSLAHTNWAPAIQQIEKAIRDLHTDPAWKAKPNCKELQESYSQAATHFGVLKDGWRNYTVHARGKYDDGEALMILLNTREFMQKLHALGLHD